MSEQAAWRTALRHIVVGIGGKGAIAIFEPMRYDVADLVPAEHQL
jgi:hypothetical protein